MAKDPIQAILPMALIRSGGLPFAAWSPLANGLPDWAALQSAEAEAAKQVLVAFDGLLASLSDGPARTAVYNARKDFFQRKKKPTGKFFEHALDAQPWVQLLGSLEHYRQTQQATSAAETLFEQKLAENYQALQAVAKDENLLRALLIASHDLLDSLPDFAQKPVADFDKKNRRSAHSLLQYLTRAVFKTSPLSQFTTVEICHFGLPPQPKKDLGEWSGKKSLVVPNVALLPVLYEVLLRDPAFYRSLWIQLNPCITSPMLWQQSWLYFDGEREAFQQIETDAVADLVTKTMLENGRQMSFPALLEVLQLAIDATGKALQSLVFQFVDIGLLEWQLPERGLSPKWADGLYQYLGYLPASPVLTEAAYLLQWLRTTARTLPFQPLGEAQKAQQEALLETRNFVEKHGGQMPPIPPEQIFFEDVTVDAVSDYPAGTLENLIADLAECWQQQDDHALPPFRARLWAFTESFLKPGESVDFLAFSRAFLESNANAGQHRSPRHRGKVGALVQVFQENGSYRAVLNALYPGGGKMFARWLPIFPEKALRTLETWNAPDDGFCEAAFPWQGWSNANFQPDIFAVQVAVPGGRKITGQTILLHDLLVRKSEAGRPQFVDKQSNRPVIFNDLGLESPTALPPVMQVLWHIGVPYVSADALLPAGLGWEQRGEIGYRRRIEFRALVLAREAWDLPPTVFKKMFAAENSLVARVSQVVTTLGGLGVPPQFFAQFTGRREKPQFFDTSSPVSMVLLEKKLRDGEENLLLTEMLPTPDQCIGDRVTECVLEWKEV